MIDLEIMPMETKIPERCFLSMAKYASELAQQGSRIVPGASGTFWMGYESAGMVRIPTFHTIPPAPREISRALWKGRASVVSYLIEPDRDHPANAWLYVCADRDYSIDKLAPAVRRNIRRGYHSLRIAPISANDLLAHGLEAFCDTRKRVGLSDGTSLLFQRRFAARARFPGHVFLGAWKDQSLAAFLSITEVDDWAEIEGCFSANATLPLRPNDALMGHALSYYLHSKRCSLVSYGLSSIQSESNEAGLHAFKTKIGFEARPVHRAFIVHPFLRPFLNRFAQRVSLALLRRMPGNRRLKKIEGVLAAITGEQRPLNANSEK